MSSRGKTLKELAEHLDVSITTVSRALAGNDKIALKTRERVAEAARQLGYVPNVAARQLVSGRSGFAGLVLPVRGPNFVDSYIGEFVTGLGEGLVEHGMDLFLATAQAGQSELSVLRHVVESGRADGVVLLRIAEVDERVDYLLKRNIPFVTHGRILDQSKPVNWLDADGEAAFAEAFDLLYDLGHRHFGLVSIAEPMMFRHLRERGLRQAIERRGDDSVHLDIVAAPRFDREATLSSVRTLIEAPQRPTAVLGLFDELALMVLEEAGRAGISVPGDLSVVGFDNIGAAAYAPPGLTTFETSTRSAGREIGSILIEVIEGRNPAPVTKLVRPSLVTRASHGPAPSATT
ncbi:LacI family DNA-binding transcriptional regulator [Devosia chinhatensis]|uniref:Hth-type transcriptional regulator n=1 Tax=Devosia chinhatensis TaxID=429727 RepID=A0A0F5FK07_9HYPH|nr:substrate-binding domain-containing protein [Devosia chinhatensis]KKB08915.1 hth-type transcriptional regulator [Devosia chinhatensis]